MQNEPTDPAQMFRNAHFAPGCSVTEHLEYAKRTHGALGKLPLTPGQSDSAAPDRSHRTCTQRCETNPRRPGQSTGAIAQHRARAAVSFGEPKQEFRMNPTRRRFLQSTLASLGAVALTTTRAPLL